MGFTVNYPDETKDAEFEVYARLLHQRGKDLGRLPRVPEPKTRNRWLYVWAQIEEAEDFATELRRQTRDNEWKVFRVDAPPSEGPFGPLLIQVSRQSGGAVFALHPVSRTLLGKAFPEARSRASTLTVEVQDWDRHFKAGKSLSDLMRDLAPALTGLGTDQVEALGFAVIDDATGDTLAFERPAEIPQGVNVRSPVGLATAVSGPSRVGVL